jgi:ferritin-like metal-binding protein YciE
MESEVRELLVEELKDAYSAEKQALRCMQKTLKMASEVVPENWTGS